MALCAATAACSAVSSPDVTLDTSDPAKPAVVLSGLSRSDLRALLSAGSRAEHIGWVPLFHVSVAPDDGRGELAIAGEYTIRSGTVRFTPVLPFEPGRSYYVTFNPGAAPNGTLAHLTRVTRVVATPAPQAGPAVHVTEIYPTGPVVPANLLRMYVEFSGPMGTLPGEEFIRLIDSAGKDMAGALLPLDTDLWNRDRTRFTILFDPGRVKRGILPNRAMGRPLHRGDTFSIVIGPGWPDAHGRPLAGEFKKEYRVGPAIERALETGTWRVDPPAAGSRDPLRVTFPSPLDRGLAQRALSVQRAGEATELAGDVMVDAGETIWRFTPRDAWQAGDHALLILPSLEDPTGNRIGRAFEAVSPDDDTKKPPVRLPFQIR